MSVTLTPDTGGLTTAADAPTLCAWVTIDTAQTSGWAALASPGSAGWGAVDTEQNTLWTPINTECYSVPENSWMFPVRGALALTGAAPELVLSTYIEPGVASLTLTGAASAVTVGTEVTVSVGGLTVTGYAPVRGEVEVSPASAVLTLAGAAPAVVSSDVVTAEAGSLVTTGAAGTVLVSITPATGALVVPGASPELRIDVYIMPSVRSLTLAGAASAVVRGAPITPSVGSLTLTGVASTLVRGTNITPSVRALTLSGVAPVVVSDTAITPSAGALTTTGVAPTVTVAFMVDAAAFDGTNDYLTRGAFAGAVDGKKGILSAWIRIDSGDSTTRVFIHGRDSTGPSTVFEFYIGSDNKFHITGRDTASTYLDIKSTSTYSATSSTWRHVLASWDLSSAGSGRLYVNDVSDYTENTYTNSNIDYSCEDWGVGATVTGAVKFNGGLAEVYFNIGEYLDFNTESNRRLFRTSGGKPVNLGSDGSTPTGTAPIAYLHLDVGETANNFALNAATGGDFTVNGALSTCSTSPSS